MAWDAGLEPEDDNPGGKAWNLELLGNLGQENWGEIILVEPEEAQKQAKVLMNLPISRESQINLKTQTKIVDITSLMHKMLLTIIGSIIPVISDITGQFL